METIVSAAEKLKRGECTSVELTKAYLQQIKGLNSALNAYLTVFDEEAIESAKQSDERRASNQSFGVLDGIPIAVKDNILIQGTRTTAGSKILENYIGVNDATVIRKLKGAGAVILGKTNMDEFALGSSTENSAFGVTKNPHDVERVAGGTSGGSAAAVASDMCVAALGSDTGGSVRQPASFCGVVGLKPTYGRVSRSGLIAAASSFDQIGSITKTSEDARILLEVIAGEDTLDQTTTHLPVSLLRKEGTNLKGVTIGLPKEAWDAKGLSAGVRRQVEEGIAVLKHLGATVKEISLPYTDEALAVYYILNFCEVAANLERFDGMRYGTREESSTLIDTYMKSRGTGLGKEAKRRIMLGTYALSKGYYDAYYRQAVKVRSLIQKAYREAFNDVDVLLTPTAPTTAWKIGEKSKDPLEMYLEDVFTVGINVAGVPAISVPCGSDDGLPVGLQLIGDMFEEGTLLDIASAYEHAS